MSSPFPGMDPYLEPFWRDVHHALVKQTVAEAGMVDLQNGHFLCEGLASTISNQSGPKSKASGIVSTDVIAVRPGFAAFLTNRIPLPSNPKPHHRKMSLTILRHAMVANVLGLRQ